MTRRAASASLAHTGAARVRHAVKIYFEDAIRNGQRQADMQVPAIKPRGDGSIIFRAGHKWTQPMDF
jgi:hypothetical protein